MIIQEKEWYESWFDSPFYHILYQDRDYAEAKLFMDNITQYLNLPELGSILDVACGRGRHAIYLNALGYQVTGIDLSVNSIAKAKAHENKSLHFAVHDMRIPYSQQFDAVFNLFTSFGYFNNENDHLKTLHAFRENLNNTGFGVIDFMNSNYVINNLVKENETTINGITFKQKRKLEKGYITKNITFTFEGKNYYFQERVRAFSLTDFETLFAKANLNLLDVFGNYKLQKYDASTSKRLVLIFK